MTMTTPRVRFLKLAQFGVLLAAMVIPGQSLAATLTIIGPGAAPQINDVVRVDVALDTQGEAVNALQGNILYPTDKLSLRSVQDGN